MRHVLVGLRAAGEAVFWGVVGGTGYGLALFAVLTRLGHGIEPVFAFVYFGALFGLAVGVVTALIGGVAAGVLSASRAPAWVARAVGGAVAGGIAALTCYYLSTDLYHLAGSDPTTDDWLVLVVVPAAVAAGLGVWRTPIILRAPTPTVAFNAARLDTGR